MAVAGFKNYGRSGRWADGALGLEGRPDIAHLHDAPPPRQDDDEQPGILASAGEMVKRFANNTWRVIGLVAGINPWTQVITLGTDQRADKFDQNCDIQALENKQRAFGAHIRTKLAQLGTPAGEQLTAEDISIALQDYPAIAQTINEAGTTPVRTGAGIAAGFAPLALVPGAGWLLGGALTLGSGMLADTCYCAATGTDDSKPNQVLEIVARITADKRMPLQKKEEALGLLDDHLAEGRPLEEFQLPGAERMVQPAYNDNIMAYGHPSGLPAGLHGNVMPSMPSLSMAV